MAKVNFTKAEQSFEKALQKLLIDNLSEIAEIANLAQDPQKEISKNLVETIARFQKELIKMKRELPLLYEKLNLTTEEEAFLTQRQAADYSHEDWNHLKNLRARIDDLKRELYGQEVLSKENDSLVEKERKRHINKRHNIREGWLPLK